MPNHLFNTLSQVAGQTPAAFQGASNYPANYGGAYSYQVCLSSSIFLNISTANV